MKQHNAKGVEHSVEQLFYTSNFFHSRTSFPWRGRSLYLWKKDTNFPTHLQPVKVKSNLIMKCLLIRLLAEISPQISCVVPASSKFVKNIILISIQLCSKEPVIKPIQRPFPRQWITKANMHAKFNNIVTSISIWRNQQESKYCILISTSSLYSLKTSSTGAYTHPMHIKLEDSKQL